MSDSYVTSKATLRCSCGDRTAKITVYPDRTVELTEKPTANISDHISMYNIAPFGKCHTTNYPPTGAATAVNKGKLTPMPCIPGTDSDWINGKDDYIIKGKSALLKSSYCCCKWGGVITVIDDGQVDTGSVDSSRIAKESEEEINANTEEKFQLEPEAVLDGIQLVLDAAGLVPGVGAIPDLLNASIYALRGDFGNAGLSVLAAVPIIGDAATATKFVQKGLKVAKTARKTGKATNSIVDKVILFSKYRVTKTQDTIGKLDNVTCFPSEKVSNTNPLGTKGIQKQDNVLYMDKYERKVVKQVNGQNEVFLTEKTDKVVCLDSYRVNKVESIPRVGSSTDFKNSNSYSGQRGGNEKRYGSYKKQNLERKKKNIGLSLEEETLLKELEEREKNGSIFGQ